MTSMPTKMRPRCRSAGPSVAQILLARGVSSVGQAEGVFSGSREVFAFILRELGRPPSAPPDHVCVSGLRKGMVYEKFMLSGRRGPIRIDRKREDETLSLAGHRKMRTGRRRAAVKACVAGMKALGFRSPRLGGVGGFCRDTRVPYSRTFKRMEGEVR